MTQYVSKIELGKIYREPRSSIQGYATKLFFNENGCVETYLEYTKDGERKMDLFNQLELEKLVDPEDGSNELVWLPAVALSEIVYESDIILGEIYEAIRDGFEGHAVVLNINEHIATRVELSRRFENKTSGKVESQIISLDDFLVRLKTSSEPVARKDNKPSPVRSYVRTKD